MRRGFGNLADAWSFADRMRRERFHDPEAVFVTDDHTGAIVEDRPARSSSDPGGDGDRLPHHHRESMLVPRCETTRLDVARRGSRVRIAITWEDGGASTAHAPLTLSLDGTIAPCERCIAQLRALHPQTPEDGLRGVLVALEQCRLLHRRPAGIAHTR